MEMASATEKLNSYFILINLNLKMYLIFLKKSFKVCLEQLGYVNLPFQL